MVIRLFVPATREIVLEDAAFCTLQVVADIERHDDQSLKDHRQIGLDHLSELVGLPLTRQLHTL